MFAVVDVGNAYTSYVPGVFRNRKVARVSKTPRADPVGHENQPDDQPTPRQALPSFPTRLYQQVQAFSDATSSTILARDIMASPVTTLPLTASLAQAWELVKNTRFRHIPIESRVGSLVGILSDRDLSRATVESALSGINGAAHLAAVTIESQVSHPVLVANPEATLLAIVRVLLEERIGAMPVVSSEKALLGMITRSDILRVIVSHPSFEQWG